MLRRRGSPCARWPTAPRPSPPPRQPPDLAILDVKMPGMDGFEACRKLKSHDATRHIPVLMLSATFLETEAQVEGLDTGADAYLTQPVEAPVLAATVRSLLRARRAEAEVRAAASEWQTTFEAITDAVAVLDAAGTVERANRAFAAIFGDASSGTRSPPLDVARRGELTSASASSACASTRWASPGEVVTLSDITAARPALAAERSISRTLQQTLLPTRLPERADLALDAWHVAAELELIVGGDWYDVIETRRGLWLVMGDVAGHGVSATAQAGQLRHSLRVYAHEGFGLAESVRRLNELLTGSDGRGWRRMCIVEVATTSRTRWASSAPGTRRRCCCPPTGRRGWPRAHRRRARRDRGELIEDRVPFVRRGPARALHRRPDRAAGRHHRRSLQAARRAGRGVEGLAAAAHASRRAARRLRAAARRCCPAARATQVECAVMTVGLFRVATSSEGEEVTCRCRVSSTSPAKAGSRTAIQAARDSGPRSRSTSPGWSSSTPPACACSSACTTRRCATASRYTADPRPAAGAPDVRALRARRTLPFAASARNRDAAPPEIREASSRAGAARSEIGLEPAAALAQRRAADAGRADEVAAAVSRDREPRDGVRSPPRTSRPCVGLEDDANLVRAAEERDLELVELAAVLRARAELDLLEEREVVPAACPSRRRRS